MWALREKKKRTWALGLYHLVQIPALALVSLQNILNFPKLLFTQLYNGNYNSANTSKQQNIVILNEAVHVQDTAQGPCL